MKKIVAITVLLLAMLSSCINLKDEYPDITYYSLNDIQSNISEIKQVDGALLIRNFSISSEFDTKHLLANWDSKRVQKYYYHRWISDISDMTTDYIFNRISKLKVFSNGAISSTSMIIPDYILEGQIINLAVNNTDLLESGNNNAEIEIKINLIIRNKEIPGETTIFTQVYKEEVLRQNNLVTSIAPAVSRGISLISDKIAVDIKNAIVRNNLGMQ